MTELERIVTQALAVWMLERAGTRDAFHTARNAYLPAGVLPVDAWGWDAR